MPKKRKTLPKDFEEMVKTADIEDLKAVFDKCELVSWLLGRCGSVKEARELLSDINIIDIPFSGRLPLSPLHWHIADSESSIVLESTKGGIRIYDNPAGVLTNNPPFDFQMTISASI